jgi:hypothetical protein
MCRSYEIESAIYLSHNISFSHISLVVGCLSNLVATLSSRARIHLTEDTLTTVLPQPSSILPLWVIPAYPLRHLHTKQE